MLASLSEHGSTLPDVMEYEKALACTGDSRFGALGMRFEKEKPVYVVRAPARLDCMGGIADYSGSLVCELTLDRAVLLGIQARDDRKVVLHSADVDALGLLPDVALPLEALNPGTRPANYASLRRKFSQAPDTAWAAYVAGAFSILQGEGYIDRFPHGATIVLASDIPLRVGVSSSAALEIAAMYGLSLLYGIELDGMVLALLAQQVENEIVGAACGIMDQATSALGNQDRLLSLLCQPHTLREHLPIPAGLRLIGINSGVRRQIKGSRYTHARTGAFMGLAIIRHMQRSCRDSANPNVGAYLCNLTPAEFTGSYRSLLPARMTGKTFARRYGEAGDSATKVDPEVKYNVRSRVEHAIYEHRRVTAFTECIRRAGATGETGYLEQAGRLMYASDWSYRHRCGLGSPETSWIVRETRKLGLEAGFYGARITGGGAGGTVAVAGDDRMLHHLDRLLARYGESTGIEAEIFAGSSPGALEFGHRVYRIT